MELVMFLYGILVVLWLAYGIVLWFPNIPNKILGALKIINGKTVYNKYTLGGHTLDIKHKKMIRDNQNLLLEHRVPINKVKFVFQPTFTYDIDKNTINPVYHVMLPHDNKTGLFKKDEPVIEVGKPANLIMVLVDSYTSSDNYEQLKRVLKKSKLGVVIFLADEMIDGLPYKFSVDDDVIRYANLDSKVLAYKGSEQEIQTV